MAISNAPWSAITQADYTPEQWRRACLIDTGEGDPNSKSRYKLPVKEPNGDVNRNGMHAAAAVLAGARGGVNAPADAKRAAARKLLALYHQAGEDPPETVRMMAGM